MHRHVLVLACLASAAAQKNTIRFGKVSSQPKTSLHTKWVESHGLSPSALLRQSPFRHLGSVSQVAAVHNFLGHPQPYYMHHAQSGTLMARSMSAVDAQATGDDRFPAEVYPFFKARGFECDADGCVWKDDLAGTESWIDHGKTAIANAEGRLARAKTAAERTAAEAEVRRIEAALELALGVQGRALHFAGKVRGGLLHLDEAGLKSFGPALTDIIEKDAAEAASSTYGDSLQYVERVKDLAVRELDSAWARAKAKDLLKSHGYKTLRRDIIFGPYIRAAERIGLDQVSSEYNMRRMHKLMARVGLLAASKLWSSPLPVPGKRRMADVVVTEALQLMAATYASTTFVEIADQSLEDHRQATLKAGGAAADLNCPWPFVLVHAPLGGAQKHPGKTAILATIAAWYGVRWGLGLLPGMSLFAG